MCEFTYKAGSWKGARILKAIRTVKEYVETDFFEKAKLFPFTNTLVISALMNLTQQNCIKSTNNVSPANFAMRETNTKLVLIGERRSKICKAKPG